MPGRRKRTSAPRRSAPEAPTQVNSRLEETLRKHSPSDAKKWLPDYDDWGMDKSEVKSEKKPERDPRQPFPRDDAYAYSKGIQYVDPATGKSVGRLKQDNEKGYEFEHVKIVEDPTYDPKYVSREAQYEPTKQTELHTGRIALDNARIQHEERLKTSAPSSEVSGDAAAKHERYLNHLYEQKKAQIINTTAERVFAAKIGHQNAVDEGTPFHKRTMAQHERIAAHREINLATLNRLGLSKHVYAGPEEVDPLQQLEWSKQEPGEDVCIVNPSHGVQNDKGWWSETCKTIEWNTSPRGKGPGPFPVRPNPSDWRWRCCLTKVRSLRWALQMQLASKFKKAAPVFM